MTEKVKTKHPEITAYVEAEWSLMRASFDGESAIKAARETYLPMPSGFSGTGDPQGAYSRYLARAQFPEILAPSVAAMVGVVHGAEINIEMPDALGFLWEAASNDGLTLEAFHRRITRQLLVAGRFGVLADAPEAGGDPFLTGYTGPSVINWDEGFYVLDETHYARAGFEWHKVPRYRVLRLEDGFYTQEVYEGEKLENVTALDVRTRGGQRLPEIPFTVANARDLLPAVESPPLIGVARAALAIYQLNADYRHQLFMSGQETLVAINGEPPEYVGAGVVHAMHGGDTAGSQPDLKYVAPACTGIDAHREAMQDNREAAVMAGARMLEQSEGVEESGEARKLRFASETANLQSVALVSCALLERGLRHCAMLAGLNPDDVSVQPPTELMDRTLTPAEAETLMRLWQNGAISYETFYDAIRKGGIANPERDAEEELASIDDAEFRDRGLTL